MIITDTISSILTSEMCPGGAFAMINANTHNTCKEKTMPTTNPECSVNTIFEEKTKKATVSSSQL